MRNLREKYVNRRESYRGNHDGVKKKVEYVSKDKGEFEESQRKGEIKKQQRRE